MSKKIDVVQGILKLLSERHGLQQKVELWLLNGKVTGNHSRYENLERHHKKFAETPLLVAYIGEKIGDGHNFEEIRNPDGSVSASFMGSTAERIVGWIKTADDVRMETIDGVEWIVATGYIWAWYAAELVAKLKRQGFEGMSVSIETLITEMHTEDGIEVYTEYEILGTTLLAEDVPPAVAQAHIRALSTMSVDEVRTMTLRVASQQTNKKTKSTEGEHKVMEHYTVAELRDKFPGYRVLSVRNENVVLLSVANGGIAGYTFNEGETADTIAIDRVKAISLNAVIGDTPVEIAVESILGGVQSELEAAKSANQSLTEDNAKKAAEIKTLQEAEHARRCDAAKQAIKNALAKFNSNRADAEKVAEDACEELVKSAESGAYCEVCNSEGKWMGDEKAANDVYAICAKKQMGIDEKTAEIRRNQSQKHWAFDPENAGAKSDVDSIDALVADLK